MLSRQEELTLFKRQIHLGHYAAYYGYVLDRKSSSRSSLLLKHPNGDKIVIALDHDDHWIYFSVRDDRDNGSIIDFVQHRQGGSLGDVRKVLRPFLQTAPSPALLQTGSEIPTLQCSSKDLVRVRVNFEAMEPIAGLHPYLEEERRIPAAVLRHPRFLDQIRCDARGNAVFPHFNLSGLCGYELKNHHFTGFASGGEKGLWSSRREETDETLVITESAIDALSFFALKQLEHTCYVSTAGSLSASQPELIRRAADRLPERGCVILATDQDAGGDKLAAAIRTILAPVATRLRLVEDRPALPGEDWSDVLKNVDALRERAKSGVRG